MDTGNNFCNIALTCSTVGHRLVTAKFRRPMYSTLIFAWNLVPIQARASCNAFLDVDEDPEFV